MTTKSGRYALLYINSALFDKVQYFKNSILLLLRAASTIMLLSCGHSLSNKMRRMSILPLQHAYLGLALPQTHPFRCRNCRIERSGQTAAPQQLVASHGTWYWCNTFRHCRCPLQAAALHAFSSAGQPCSRTYCRQVVWPAAAKVRATCESHSRPALWAYFKHSRLPASAAKKYTFSSHL